MKIILGTAQFGLEYGINNTTGKLPENKVFEILDYAALNGITILDTADAYGNSIDIIGKNNAMHPGRFVINTKFKSIGTSLSEQIKASLAKLKRDNINVYFYHSYKDFVDHPLIQLELEKLKNDGKIGKIGLSVYDNDEFRLAIDSEIVEVIQFPFNLLDNLSQRGNLIKRAKDKGKELQIRSVFLQGLFFKPLDRISLILGPLKPYLQKIHKLAKENHLKVDQLALLYALKQTEIDQIVLGVDNLEQLRYNLSIQQQVLLSEISDKINQIKVRETELLYPKNWN